MEQSEPSKEVFERLVGAEHARINAEAHYSKDPKNADNLTKWAEALLELSQLGDVNRGRAMVNDAISKLDEALLIDKLKHEALWCLGKARSTLAFLTPDDDEAQALFQQASDSYQKAVDQSPENKEYLEALATSSEALTLHRSIHKYGGFSQTQKPSGDKSTAAKNPAGKMYELLGWVILAAGIAIWIGMAKSHAPGY